MEGRIGSAESPSLRQTARMARMAALSLQAGVTMPLDTRDPIAVKTAQMLGGKVGAAQGATCEPDGGCEVPLDPRVFGSVAMMLKGNGIVPNPPNSGFTDQQWNSMSALVRADKYCPSPRRVGWQPSSLTFVTTDQNGVPTTINNNVTAQITVTSTHAFCSAAMVAATQTSNDKLFSISSVTVNGEEQVDDGPWNSTLYTPEASCCTCAREWPIVEAGSDVIMTITNLSGNAAVFFTQVFGKKLYC